MELHPHFHLNLKGGKIENSLLLAGIWAILVRQEITMRTLLATLGDKPGWEATAEERQKVGKELADEITATAEALRG